MEGINDHMGEMDAYERKQLMLGVTRINNEMEKILRNEDMSDEEKQAALDALEIELQNHLSTTMDDANGVTKLLYLVGRKIDESAEAAMETQLAEDSQVKRGLSEEAKVRKDLGMD